MRAKPSLSQVAAYLLNVCIAALGTNIVESPFTHFFRTSPRAVVLREDFLSITAAFALGYVVYRVRQPGTAKWVWFAGLCWFIWGTLHMWLGHGALRLLTGTQGTIYWEMSGFGCMSELDSCWNWIEFTLPLLRTIFYSAGAFCCSRCGPAIEGVVLSRVRAVNTA